MSVNRILVACPSAQGEALHKLSLHDALSGSTQLEGHDSAKTPGALTLHTRAEFASQEHSFDAASYFSHLSTTALGQTLAYSDRVTSTQTLMMSELKQLPVNSVFSASVQVSGVGRGANLWESPDGCLMFSMKCSTRRPELLPHFQYLVSLALVDSIRAQCAGVAEVDLRIKWPNDIYGGEQKIGGLICQSTFHGGVYHVLVGCGINVSNQQPTTCLNDLLRFLPAADTSFRYSRAVVLARFLNTFEEYLQRFEKHGFRPFVDSYLSCWMHTGQLVTVEKGVLAHPGDGSTQVRIVGLASNGFLEGEQVSSGRRVELHPDGNSLDWFKGLISRKVHK